MQTHVNGITLAYSDRGTGLPIVFLHAFPLNRTMWAEQEEASRCSSGSSQSMCEGMDSRMHRSGAIRWNNRLTM